jgi:hypothetical protein
VACLNGIGLHYYMSGDYLDLRAQVDSYLQHLLQSLEIPGEKGAAR